MKKISYQAIRQRLSLPKRRFASLGFLGLAGLCGASTALLTNPVGARASHDKANTEAVVSRLNALQTQVTSLEEAVKKPSAEADSQQMALQIKELSSRLETIRSDNSDQWNQSLSRTETALSHEMNAIKDALNRLDKPKSVQYLRAESLPFKVLSIDSIQQVPVVSVLYDFKTWPLEKGDALAGWKVLAVDYSKQQLELVNAKKEHVLLKHEHIG